MGPGRTPTALRALEAALAAASPTSQVPTTSPLMGTTTGTSPTSKQLRPSSLIL